jgi:hypothetical protein
MKPATLKNLDIFEGRQGNIEERQYSSKYAIMESAADFVTDFVPAGLGNALRHGRELMQPLRNERLIICRGYPHREA